MPSSIAIIGAGVSGLAAAHILRDAGYTVTLYEKSAAPGGRAATRQREGFIYDHGAQYIKHGKAESVTFILERFPSPELIDISKPVWTFDGAGTIHEGDPEQNAEPKWSYRYGLRTLPQLMASTLTIRYQTQITRVQQTSTGWLLFTSDGTQVGDAAQLLITLPAQQAIDLLQTSELDNSLRTQIAMQLGQAHYNPLISVMLGYRPRPRTRPYYALVNTDKAHQISWLAWEHEKAPERAPADAGLLIAQMEPGYSQQHRETNHDEIIRDVASRVSVLIEEPLLQPIFADIQYWRYALPSAKTDANALNALTLPAGLAFCGDSFVGGRLHLALEHGISVARQLTNQ